MILDLGAKDGLMVNIMSSDFTSGKKARNHWVPRPRQTAKK